MATLGAIGAGHAEVIAEHGAGEAHVVTQDIFNPVRRIAGDLPVDLGVKHMGGHDAFNAGRHRRAERRLVVLFEIEESRSSTGSS